MNYLLQKSLARQLAYPSAALKIRFAANFNVLDLYTQADYL